MSIIIPEDAKKAKVMSYGVVPINNHKSLNGMQISIYEGYPESRTNYLQLDAYALLQICKNLDVIAGILGLSYMDNLPMKKDEELPPQGPLPDHLPPEDGPDINYKITGGDE